MPVRAAIIACALLVMASTPVSAQPHRIYAGASVGLHLQRHSDTEPLGGDTWGGSVVVGGQVSPRAALEVETYVGGPFTAEYSYNPGPSWSVNVEAKRRDTVVAFQWRSRVAPWFEPVVGIGDVVARLSRRATYADRGGTYFDDSDTRHALGIVAGADAPVRVAARFSIVPSVRILVTSARRANDDFTDSLGQDTDTGRTSVRVGVGGRFGF